MSSLLRILQLEDDPLDAELSTAILRDAGIDSVLKRVESRQDFITALNQDQYDLILADFSLPSFDGLTAVRLARELQPDVPVILLSGTMGEEAAIESLKSGATDYVLKQRLERLVPSVNRALQEAQDKRARRQAEEALRQSEQRFRALVENIREVFWIRTADTLILQYVSPAFEEIWGQSPEEFYKDPQRWLETVHDNDRQRVRNAFEQMLNGGEFLQEYRITRPDGSLRWVRDRGTLARDSSTDTTHIVGIAEDVTQQQQLEEQLLQAQKLEGIGQLAGGVAHDFNNILQVVFAHTDFALSKVASSHNGYQHLLGIRDAADKASALTKQLLAFSRRQMLQPEDVDLNELTSRLMKMLSRIIGEDMFLEMQPGPELWPVHVDPVQVEQVLLNLVVNARDAMPDGGSITLSTKNFPHTHGVDDPRPWIHRNDWVVISVRDAGLGMDEETQRQIFEPFFTTKGVGKGTGLGLSTVYGIIRQHGGHIEVRSTKGKGTTFDIYLPRCEQCTPSSSESPELLTAPQAVTILVAEDDNDVRELVTRILQDAGHQVFTASNGERAIEVFAAHPDEISLVLLDMVMPGLGGKEALERIREIRPDVPALISSGYSFDAVHNRFVPAAGMHLIRKPYLRNDLLHAIDKALAETRR